MCALATLVTHTHASRHRDKQTHNHTHHQHTQRLSFSILSRTSISFFATSTDTMLATRRSSVPTAPTAPTASEPRRDLASSALPASSAAAVLSAASAGAAVDLLLVLDAVDMGDLMLDRRLVGDSVSIGGSNAPHTMCSAVKPSALGTSNAPPGMNSAPVTCTSCSVVPAVRDVLSSTLT